MTQDDAKKLAKRTLSEKRYRHTLNVKKLAVQMAHQFGEDPQKAALAALLHDICKEWPRARMLQLLNNHAIMGENPAARPAPVWHGSCAAIYAREELGVDDQEVLDAIRCHTTGKEGMTRLDKILFLADMTSEDRSFPGVEELRRLALKDLDRGMLAALECSLGFLRQENKPVDPQSLAAYLDIKNTVNRCPNGQSGKDYT